jgi:hypothetical protein
MGITAWFVILPLCLTSLTTGLVQALGTAWGLLRHYWIMFKLLLTVVATVIFLMKLGPISSFDQAGQENFSAADHTGLQVSLLIHAIGGLTILLAIIVLAVYKPRGMTPYGIRKQQQQKGTATADHLAVTVPYWVKAVGTVVITLVILVLIMLLVGGHGPGTHFSHH